jgi:hypothetical protein
LFAKFLQAGSARVQVPVRVGFETPLFNYFNLGGIAHQEFFLPNSNDQVPDSLQLSLINELKEQLGNKSIDGPGSISVQDGSFTVLGVGTAFKGASDFIDSDVNRRIIIKGKTYVINRVVSPFELVLRSPYRRDEHDDSTDDNLPYAYGGVLIGQSWEVKLPTNLIKIDQDIEAKIKDFV